MKIVFMGSPEFSVPCLRVLAESGHEVAAVFTQPDKPRGRRGNQLVPTAVKSAALEYGYTGVSALIPEKRRRRRKINADIKRYLP